MAGIYLKEPSSVLVLTESGLNIPPTPPSPILWIDLKSYRATSYSYCQLEIFESPSQDGGRAELAENLRASLFNEGISIKTNFS
jgi:hypothetical protein